MSTSLPPDLIERLRRRVADPRLRTDALDWSAGSSYLGGAFETVRVPLGDSSANPQTPDVLPPPATHAEISLASSRLGFDVPVDLGQLYSAVANGGFGPADGLASLDDIATRYLDLVAESPGPAGSTWPVQLLPIGLAAPGIDCYDLTSGEIVFWDEELLAEDIDWEDSFSSQAGSLQAWLEAWLDDPPLAERVKSEIEEGLRANLRATLDHWRAMTPEQRAEFGLPEEGWEYALFGHLGIDLDDL